MTDERIRELWETNADFHWDGFEGVLRFVRAVLKEAALSASIADTAKPVIDKSMVKRLMVQYGLDKSHESIADTAGAKPQSLFIFETYTGQNGWLEVSADEFERTKDKYEHRIRRRPEPAAPPAPSVADAAGASEGQAFETWLVAEVSAGRMYSADEEAARRAWDARSAEIAALRESLTLATDTANLLRERISGMEKDAETWRDKIRQIVCDWFDTSSYLKYALTDIDAAIAKEPK